MTHQAESNRDKTERLERIRRAAAAFEVGLSEYCDGPERDELRAALRDYEAAERGTE